MRATPFLHEGRHQYLVPSSSKEKIKRFAYSLNENNLRLWYYAQVPSAIADEIKNRPQRSLQLNFFSVGVVFEMLSHLTLILGKMI